MPGSGTFLFNHTRAASTVRVDQVPKGCGQEVADLFRSIIGPTKDVQFCENGSLEITFFNPHDAMCVSSLSRLHYQTSPAQKFSFHVRIQGLWTTYKNVTVATYTSCAALDALLPLPSDLSDNSPRIVSARLSPRPRAAIQSRSSDTRRNLYVLGLPFDLSLTELSSIFSHFGTVTHSVILATVDNASRRRGFVVMSTHAEAKVAMDNISQTTIRGSIVDVSWAVVQRSQGFLDGGDRAATLEGQVNSALPCPGRGVIPAFKVSSTLSDSSRTVNSLSGARSGPTSIVVHNLPGLLFTQDSDLEPLFYPFGEVKEIRKQGPSSSGQSLAGTISVLVTYSSVASAREAKIALHGQTYGDTPLIVESFLPLYNHETSWNPARDRRSRSSLNPCASPFVVDSTLTVSAPPTCHVSEDFPDYFSKPKLSNLAPTSRGHRSLPTSNLPSRSNSAASWSVPAPRQSFYA